MLVLTRKLGQAITITTPDGSTITVRLVRITSRKARIAIDAATRFKIERTEPEEAEAEEEVTTGA